LICGTGADAPGHVRL